MNLFLIHQSFPQFLILQFHPYYYLPFLQFNIKLHLLYQIHNYINHIHPYFPYLHFQFLLHLLILILFHHLLNLNSTILSYLHIHIFNSFSSNHIYIITLRCYYILREYRGEQIEDKSHYFRYKQNRVIRNKMIQDKS